MCLIKKLKIRKANRKSSITNTKVKANKMQAEQYLDVQVSAQGALSRSWLIQQLKQSKESWLTEQE